jgi:hypothetical protein
VLKNDEKGSRKVVLTGGKLTGWEFHLHTENQKGATTTSLR